MAVNSFLDCLASKSILIESSNVICNFLRSPCSVQRLSLLKIFDGDDEGGGYDVLNKMVRKLAGYIMDVSDVKVRGQRA